MELGIRFSSYCRSVICSIWNSISCLVSGTGFSSFVQINIYVRLPFPVVLSCSIRCSSVWGKGESLILYTVELAWLVHQAYRHIACSVWYTYLSMSIKYQSSNRIHSHCLRKTWRIAILWACKARRWSPRIKGKNRAISRPFAIAIRAARLYSFALFKRFRTMKCIRCPRGEWPVVRWRTQSGSYPSLYLVI